MVQHIVSTKQFLNKTLLERLFNRADEFSKMPLAEYPKPLNHLTLATLFFEPSTRTRLSFEVAIQNLGGQLITVDNASEFSSAKKGESLEDTICTINAYADGIVIRHPEIGSAKRAARVSSVPVINAGDGAGDHPTQGLLDVYSIMRNIDGKKKLKLALVGDLLNGRTLHSTLEILMLFNVELFLISPDELRIPKKYITLFEKNKVKFTELDNWSKVIDKVDVLYMTRIQKERFKYIEDYLKLKDSYILTPKAVARMKKDAIILHPLPRVNEIDPEVDKDPRARYFDQVKNGLYVRMALLEHLFST